MSKDLLLEIGLEELPAKYVTSSSEQLKERMAQFLQANRLSFAHIAAYATPRRLAVLVSGVAERQSDLVEEVKGPAKTSALDEDGRWTKAAEGFVRSQNSDLDQVYFKEVKGVDYIHVKKHHTGQYATDVLRRLGDDVVTKLTFPVSMRWGDHTLAYLRPIRWLVALYGHEVIPFRVLHVDSGATTRGHRFLGQDITLTHPSEYVAALRQQFVLVDEQERTATITNQIKELAEQHHWQIPVDPQLLQEVSSLVEYPTAFVGRFDDQYVALPDAVLATSMKEHQRYFYVTDKAGALQPYFVAVRNGNRDHLETVIKGNQKVLTARLEDALFFYNEDLKIQIDEAVEKLKTLNVHNKIGTIYQKMERVRQICQLLAEQIGLDEEAQTALLRASEIYKFDLVTQMVAEFPELQGVMGAIYAEHLGEHPLVCQAIREHYLPTSSDGALPESTVGAVLAVADKCDTLISFFIHDMIPSGSNDPYALRRQAIGLVNIFEKFGWDILFSDLYDVLLTSVYQQPDTQLSATLTEFTLARLQQKLHQYGMRHDVIEAVIHNKNQQLANIVAYAEELQRHVADDDFKEVVEALTRVVNLGKKAKETEGFIRTRINERLFHTNSEVALFYGIQQISTTAPAAERYADLVKLTPLITDFFNENMVLVDELIVRNNRLNLLRSLANVILTFADPSKLVVK